MKNWDGIVMPQCVPVTKQEKERLAKHTITHEKRWHYRYVASVLAQKGSALLPDQKRRQQT